MIFFALLGLLLLGGVSFYLYYRLRPLLPMPGTVKGVVAKLVFVLLMMSFFVGFALQAGGMYAASAPFTIVGSWMLAAILYLLLVFVLVDIARIVNSFTFRAEFLLYRCEYGNSAARFMALISCIVVALVLIAGYFNARFPVTRTIVYETDKPVTRSFKYVLLSDIHLGMIHCDHFMEILRDRINSVEDLDFVVIAGDFFDGDPNPVVSSNVGGILRGVNTGYGIFACTGNHEWIGNVDTASDFLRRNGVTVLRDSAAQLPFGVSIIGRDDLSHNSRREDRRKSVREIIGGGVDTSSYMIVLDHQPPRVDRYSEIVESNIDIQLSGHTHAGAQLWPLCIFTSRMYGAHNYGQVREGNTEFYTSSGYGTWGPPIRTSSRPEIVIVEVRPRK